MATNSEILQSLKASIFLKQLLSKAEKGAIIFNRLEPNYYTAHETLTGNCLEPTSGLTLWEYHVTRMPTSGSDIIVMDIAKNKQSFLTFSSIANSELVELYAFLEDLSDFIFEHEFDEMMQDLDYVKTGDQILIVDLQRAGVIVGGEAPSFRIWPGFSGSDGVEVGGAGIPSLAYISQGGVELSGSAIVDKDYLSKGGVSVGGSSFWTDPLAHEIASGGVQVGGDINIGTPVLMHETGSGGIVLSGNLRRVYTTFIHQAQPYITGLPHPGWNGDHTNVAFDVDTPNTVNPLLFEFSGIPTNLNPSNNDWPINFTLTTPPGNSELSITGVTFCISATPVNPAVQSLVVTWNIVGQDIYGNFQQLYYSTYVAVGKKRYIPVISSNGGTVTELDGSVTSNISGNAFAGGTLSITAQCKVLHPPNDTSNWSVGALEIEMVGNTYTETF